MKYGSIDGLIINDYCREDGRRTAVVVTVDFVIDRSVLFEFIDALQPINRDARREPIKAILDYSAVMGMQVYE